MHASTFRQRLRASMIGVDLSPAQMARRIGVSRQTVYRWLACDEAPAIDGKILIRLADAVRVAGRYLLIGGNEPALCATLTPDESILLERFRAMHHDCQRKLMSAATKRGR